MLPAPKQLSDKQRLLLDYVRKHSIGPKQGTDEWRIWRKQSKSVGGSTIATFLGVSGTPKKLMCDMLGLNNFNGNAATCWGTVFENITDEFFEDLLRAKVHAVGTVPGCIPDTSYSPDGLVFVKADTIRELIAKDILPSWTPVYDSIVLLEFKAPHSRPIGDTIPTYYIPQPKSGLCHIPICDIAYFGNMMYRVCSLKQLQDQSDLSYNLEYHNKIEYINKYNISGMIAIYKKYDGVRNYRNVIRPTQEQFQLTNYVAGASYHRSVCSENGCIVIPVLSRKQDIDTCLYGVANNENYEAVYFKLNWQKSPLWLSSTIEAAFSVDDSTELVGLLPFKMLDFKIIPVEREENYVASCQKEIEKFMETFKVLYAEKQIMLDAGVDDCDEIISAKVDKHFSGIF